MIRQQEKGETLLQAELQKQKRLQKDLNSNAAGQVRITFYTDPLCCWSWAFEDAWRQFVANYSDQIVYSYVLCGMIPDWTTYRDEMNSVSNPLQLGPIWMHASQITGVPMKYSIWHEDPPASSYPACLAVKTASIQSKKAEEQYLSQVRRDLMLEGKNIAKRTVLLDAARKLDGPEFSFNKFQEDWSSGRGKELLKGDLQKAKLNNIGRYPSITFQKDNGEGIIIVGYRPYVALQETYENFKSCV
jgi:putative protein-disulfide isomerase